MKLFFLESKNVSAQKSKYLLLSIYANYYLASLVNMKSLLSNANIELAF